MTTTNIEYELARERQNQPAWHVTVYRDGVVVGEDWFWSRSGAEYYAGLVKL
jgi:hypothetical protein